MWRAQGIGSVQEIELQDLFPCGKQGCQTIKAYYQPWGLTLGILWGGGQDRALGRSRPTPVALPKGEIPRFRNPILAW